jgi:23S rRNA pseudouridine1911/1915/1917 synthase
MPEIEDIRCFTADREDANSRLDQWLSDCIPEWSRTRIQMLIRDGYVEANGRRDWRPRDSVIAGTTYSVHIPASDPVDVHPENIPLDVLHEDQDLIVINKPAGLVVHPAPGHPNGTLVNALLFRCRDLQGVGGELRPGIIHRLDRDTSGVMVVAKNQMSMDALARQFQQRLTEKEYAAIVVGCPQPAVGRIETLIGRSASDRKKMSASPPRGKTAVTHYRLTERLGDFSMVTVKIETGRTHQIRVHMAHIGCPVAGDSIYGGRFQRQWKHMAYCDRQLLHARRLSFIHPGLGERVEYSAPLPDDMLSFSSEFRDYRA